MFETRDMGFAAYLVRRGHKIAFVRRTSRMVSWAFNLPAGDLSLLEAEWPTSEEYAFHSTYMALKAQVRGG
jgi:hypothetical protein